MRKERPGNVILTGTPAGRDRAGGGDAASTGRRDRRSDESGAARA